MFYHLNCKLNYYIVLEYKHYELIIIMENLDEYNQDRDLMTNGGLSPGAKENLNNSAIWVKIIAIVSLVGSVLGILGGLFILFVTPVLGIIYLAMYAFAIYVSLLLLNVAKSVERGTFDMDKFAENFLKYWKIMAIFMIIGIALGIIGGIFGAVSGTMMLQGM